MKNARVLLVCQFGLPIRGLSPYCNELLKLLQSESDFDVHAVDYQAAYPRMLHPAANSPVENRTGGLHWGNPFSWQRVAQIEAAVIHLQHWSSPMAYYLSFLASMAKGHGKRVVITVHNPGAHEDLKITHFFERKLFDQADILVVHDARGAETLCERYAINTDRIRIIPHGICVQSEPDSIRVDDHSNLGLDPTRRYICIFGNLRGYKGVDILLEAWSKVIHIVPTVDLVIAGRLWSGTYGLSSQLVARILGTSRDAGRINKAMELPGLVDRVHLFEGFQSDENLNSLIRLSELAVFPYVRFHSQSGAACRAAGQGCPVLVSDAGGLPMLAIDSSWIVAPAEPKTLASVITDKLLNPDYLMTQREAQIKRIRDHAWHHVSSLHASMYKELI